MHNPCKLAQTREHQRNAKRQKREAEGGEHVKEVPSPVYEMRTLANGVPGARTFRLALAVCLQIDDQERIVGAHQRMAEKYKALGNTAALGLSMNTSDTPSPTKGLTPDDLSAGSSSYYTKTLQLLEEVCVCVRAWVGGSMKQHSSAHMRESTSLCRL